MTESNLPPLAIGKVLSELWAHQSKEATYRAFDPAEIFLWDPRVGKTRGVLAQAVHWFNVGVTRVLVVAPQTVCADVWSPECVLCFPIVNPATRGIRSVQTVGLYSGTLLTRRRLLKQLTFNKSNLQPTIAIVNRDAIHELRIDLLAWGPQAVILDELHDYKTPSSLRHRAAYRLARSARFTRGLTGTPTPKHYGDIYGQWKVISPNIFGTSQESFREQYLVMDRRYTTRVIGYRNVAELRNKAFSIASIVRRSDCFDIPDVQTVVRKIALPEKAKSIYREIVEKHVRELEDGKLLALDHTLARLTVLQQLAGGYDPSEKRWLHDALIDTCEAEVNDILEAGQKVVIFHRFIHEGDRLQQRFKDNAAWVHGNTPSKLRAEYLDRFRTQEQPQVLIMQEEVGAYGISLAVTDYTIFYSCGLKSHVHTQAQDRTFKPKRDEDHKLTRIYLQAIGTVHTWVYNLIKNKQEASEALLKPGTTYRGIAFGDEE